MAGGNVYNKNDSMDINELAALNEADFSVEYIEELQAKITQQSEATNFSEKKPQFDEKDDTTLFEEPQQEETQENDTSTSDNNQENADNQTDLNQNEQITEEQSQNNEASEANESTVAENVEEKENNVKEKRSKKSASVQSFDDNFIKKYKAKLNKQKENTAEEDTTLMGRSNNADEAENSLSINELSNGNITEREITQEQIDYNNSLDFLDGNVKYSKYVIYIDPQNVDFIESLTVKERKNLINRIIREQDDIKITKNKFRVIQAVINHVLIAILTIAISIPVLYYTLNASLEATIDNYRRSQTNFQILYKNHGKISNKK